ncbi:hypothetical protein I4U23_023309 [Adineta vaga]|nr:hypothetical protein I4U23_023309 [Adineta vaga]
MESMKKLQSNSKNKPSSTSTSLSNTYTTELYINSAKSISEQIRDDKNECRSIVSEYGVDPNELLHLLERWTQQLIFEYKQRRERFKLLLKEKWERGELNNMKSNEESNRRLLHVHIQKLNEWQQIDLPNMKHQFDDLKPTSNIKDITTKSIDNLLEIIASIGVIHQNTTNVTTISSSLNETIDQLKRIKTINEKEYNTICIIGLEKAGKSSFINALLGFELLPFRIERCTQIQTILKPPCRENPTLFATIEFYDSNEFLSLINKLPKKKDETNNEYEKRVTYIRQTQQNTVTKDKLRKHYQTSDEAQRRTITRELHAYIANEVYLNIVKHVIIYTNKLPGENYILLDVPGCDSPIVEHRTSAINAVRNSDAFFFLTDGQRPSLTNDQIYLLNEIQDGHFDGMKRAFGIITKLDLCQTRAKYQEHRTKTQAELEQKNFLHEHIFTVAANVNLLEETKSDSAQLRQIQQHIDQYDSLLDGFNKCKQTLSNYIEYELPHTRFRQVVDMAQQKISRYVQDAIKIGRQIIPSDSEESLENYIKRLNIETWNDTFDNERYLPVLSKAAYQFQIRTEEIIKENHLIEKDMLERHDIAVFQMNPYDIEAQEREKIVKHMLQVVQHTSQALANYMYEKYVQVLEKILNDICPEQGDLFQSNLTIEQCEIEVRTLVLRVTHSVIMATIRWPHIYRDNRIAAAEELARIAPTIAYNVYENSQQEPNSNIDNLGKTIGVIFETIMVNNISNGILMALFRR